MSPALPSALAGRRALVIGLGLFGGGVAAVRHLVRCGAEVTVTDLRDARALGPSLQALDGLPVRYRLGGQWCEDVAGADLVVANPGVPEDCPLLVEARRRGTPVTAELNLFVAACPTSRIVGVTGTNGKSTTAAMAAAMLAATGTRTWLGGNIGRSLLDHLDEIGPDDHVVLEISSFQLEALRWMAWSPAVGVFTTFTANHLDRHKTMESYLDAKREIYLHQSAGDTLVLGADDPGVMELAAEAPSRVVPAGTRAHAPIAPSDVPLPGHHNLANAAMAAAAARAAGADDAAIVAGLRGFRGLPHRLELVSERGGVRWFNDSIATNPESVYVALDALADRGPIHWIGGGAGKDLDLRPLCHRLARRVQTAYCIGREGPAIAKLLRTFRGPRRSPEIVEVETLDEAVAALASAAQAGSSVLMAPACASFDQYTNFAARGEAFRRLVARLPESASVA
jgi:UDP-N-acetylmuramoylalanine--D-glutamate ligase